MVYLPCKSYWAPISECCFHNCRRLRPPIKNMPDESPHKSLKPTRGRIELSPRMNNRQQRATGQLKWHRLCSSGREGSLQYQPSKVCLWNDILQISLCGCNTMCEFLFRIATLAGRIALPSKMTLHWMIHPNMMSQECLPPLRSGSEDRVNFIQHVLFQISSSNRPGKHLYTIRINKFFHCLICPGPPAVVISSCRFKAVLVKTHSADEGL